MTCVPARYVSLRMGRSGLVNSRGILVNECMASVEIRVFRGKQHAENVIATDVGLFHQLRDVPRIPPVATNVGGDRRYICVVSTVGPRGSARYCWSNTDSTSLYSQPSCSEHWGGIHRCHSCSNH
ncbi:MAG: hypothetical protein Ct9H90mP16_14300 [Candidatus Poseidoniales archaeon]|nr:MAG: hypothetical protein Ct9H90mP16_14300 [Candidatus Poseidoniales archaeon]